MTANRAPTGCKRHKMVEYPQCKVAAHPIVLVIAYFTGWLVVLALYIMGTMT